MERLAWKREVKSFFRSRNLTQDKIAAEMNIDSGNLSKMINGKGRKVDPFVEYIKNTYGKDLGMPDDVAVKNDANIVDVQTARPYTTNSNGVRFYERQDGQLMMQVPVVQYNALGSLADDFTPLYKDRDDEELVYFYAEKVYHGKYIAFQVEGDSMDNGTRKSFQKGDVILVRELDKQDWMPKLHIADWPFWVVCWGNNIRLKEIVSQDGSTITLHSLNPSPEYTDFQLDLKEINRLFNVIEVHPQTWRAKNL